MKFAAPSSPDQSAPGMDELSRAAEAAGYAMATSDDDIAPTVPVKETVSVSLEDSARGARTVLNLTPVPVLATADQASLIPQSVRNGAHSVRETVYGYLGYGQPA